MYTRLSAAGLHTNARRHSKPPPFLSFARKFTVVEPEEYGTTNSKAFLPQSFSATNVLIFLT